MHERKHILALARSEPLIRCPEHKRPRPALTHRVGVMRAARKQHRPGQPRESLEAEGAVIGFKASVEPQFALQKDTSDKGPGAVPMSPQFFRKRSKPGRYVARVLLHAVF